MATAKKSKPQKRKPGRPSKFTPALADEICKRLSAGESLRHICEDAKMPSQRTVFTWLANDSAFLQQYARAREAQADTLVEEILEIADDSTCDTETDDKGNVRTNHEVVARSKLRIDTRKWLMSKLAPKKYGEKLDLNVGGELKRESDEELIARMAAILSRARGDDDDGSGSDEP